VEELQQNLGKQRSCYGGKPHREVMVKWFLVGENKMVNYEVVVLGGIEMTIRK
jgi:hypothetical protein